MKKLDAAVLEGLAAIICGVGETYRKGWELTRFFQNIDERFPKHDGSTRMWWTLELLKKSNREDAETQGLPILEPVILRLADPREYRANWNTAQTVRQELNKLLALDNLEVVMEGTRPVLKGGSGPTGLGSMLVDTLSGEPTQPANEVKVMSDLPSPDVFLASAIQFLVEGGENDAAALLLSCTVELSIQIQNDSWGEDYEEVSVGVFGPRAAYDGIEESGSDIGGAIRKAFEAMLPLGVYSCRVNARAQRIEIDGSWREELKKVVRGTGVSNQGVPIEGRDIQLWHGLRFRSRTEVKIAESLQGRGILFFPNCRCRIVQDDGYIVREPDFLICQEGKWGILQVDGEPYHGGHTRAKEQKDDRLFHRFGVAVIQHVSAHECWTNTNSVVDEFLRLLRQNG